MRVALFGREVLRIEKALDALPTYGGWHRWLWEPFTGAWQRNLSVPQADLIAYPALFACISRIAQDIAKLPYKLVRESDGIWLTVEGQSPYWPVLRKPNYYQTAQQFRESWVLSKLQQGNTYALKERDRRGIVVALYVLDPYRVQPLVSDATGDVFYQVANRGAWHLPPLGDDYPARDGSIIIPATEVIHDRANTFHHPLIGVPPLCAAHWAAVKNLKILKSSAQFFTNGANPGGILTAPAGLTEKEATALTTYWADNFTGDNSGKMAVIGADLKYQALGMKAADSQLVEQMKYSDEQICQPFGVKPYKIGIGNPPAGWTPDSINVEYYGDALSPHIEAMENLLDEGLAITPPQGVEMDLSPLWRMDEGKQADTETKLVAGKIKTPDEARRKFNLAATSGGNTLWGQHQDYPLGILAERDDLDPVAVTAPGEPAPAPLALPAPDDDEDPDTDPETDKALARLWRTSPESLTYGH